MVLVFKLHIMKLHMIDVDNYSEIQLAYFYSYLFYLFNQINPQRY